MLGKKLLLSKALACSTGTGMCVIIYVGLAKLVYWKQRLWQWVSCVWMASLGLRLVEFHTETS